MTDMALSQAVDDLAKAFGSNPLAVIQRVELALPPLSGDATAVETYLSQAGFSPDTLRAALEIKRIAGQVNVLVHAAGILASLPYILEPGERIESLSLGAGNTGKDFDLTTDRRVGEFKFIAWRGGPESIRQNQVFKDYLKLLWDETARRKQLFLTGTKEALAFLRGGRALDSVLSKDVHVKAKFSESYGDRFTKVGDFYRFVESKVEVIDLRQIVPVFAVATVPAEGPSAEEL